MFTQTVATDLGNKGHDSGFKGDRNIADHNVGFLQGLAVLFHGPAVKMNGFLDVLDRFLASLSLRGASGEFRNVNGIAAPLLLLQNYFTFHDHVSFADFLRVVASVGNVTRPTLLVQSRFVSLRTLGSKEPEADPTESYTRGSALGRATLGFCMN